MKQISVIWSKEIRDTIRDRRTLLSIFLFPVIVLPFLLFGMQKFTEHLIRKVKDESVRIVIVHHKNAGRLIEYFRADKKNKIIEVQGDPEKLIRNKTADAVILIPKHYEDSLTKNRPVFIRLVINSTGSVNYKSILERINMAIQGFNREIINNRFIERAINPGLMTGVNLRTTDIATSRERAGFNLGFIIPLLIILSSLSGGMYTAIDASAGERERKTIESLLLTPVRRFELVIGKITAVATVSFTSVFLTIISMTVSYFLLGDVFMDKSVMPSSMGQKIPFAFNFRIEPLGITLILIISILLVLMFSSVLISICVYARSFREAQSYLGPMYLLVIVPLTLLAIPGLQPESYIFLLPVINSGYLFKELLVGTYNMTHVFLTIFTLIFYAAITTGIAVKIYNKETLFFK